MTNNFDSEKITKEIIEKLKSYTSKLELGFGGQITEISDGVAKISGLKEVSYLELLEFNNGLPGVAVNLESDSVGAIILGDYLTLSAGDQVKATGKVLSLGVGEELIGRILDPVGTSLDGKGKLNCKKFYPIEKIAPGVVARIPVNIALQTGLKAIDSMIPIGRGQRELIIGDRVTGKTALAIDTIINQKDQKVICVYCAIGQKTSRIAQIVDILQVNGAMDYTVIVSSSASDSAALQYLAPYSGCAIAEYFMDKGKDVLIIYDDLTKHAWAYRQISLILRRPSGREAYPGDIFYLHSRLLERACRLAAGGSITALPIIETQAGDLSSYIPTNVISITDGQIYLEADLFYAGVRPGINVGLSVSRVGGAAQIKAMKQVSGKLRLDLAQYRDLAAFTQFSSDLDEKTRFQIERGSRMMELLKQGQFVPLAVEKQVVLLFAGVNGFLDDLPVARISEFEKKYLDYMETVKNKILNKIKEEGKLTDELTEKLKEAITDFKKHF